MGALTEPENGAIVATENLHRVWVRDDDRTAFDGDTDEQRRFRWYSVGRFGDDHSEYAKTWRSVCFGAGGQLIHLYRGEEVG